MIEDTDYKFVYPDGEDGRGNILLLSGPYKDTLYRYGNIGFKEEVDGLHLHYAFDVIESPVMKPEKLKVDPDFIKFAGDMVRDLLCGTQDYEDEDGTDYIEESDIQ
jgi:hypothetical protein